MRPHKAVIVAAVRTPIGRYGGVLRDVRPDDLSAIVMREAVSRSSIDPATIDDVIWGCANQAGEDNRNIGRMSVLLAGFPSSVPATTVNRLCASSLDAVIHAARAIWSEDAACILVGGVESMSRAPYSVPKRPSSPLGSIVGYDTALGWRYPNPRLEALFPLESMGETAENLADEYTISREEQDRFALESHRKAIRAQHDHLFDDEIVTVPTKTSPVTTDEGPRSDSSLDALTRLKPAFRAEGTVTAGNSSGLNDGAAALVIMEERLARSRGVRPLARIVSTGVAGVDPRRMGIGPVPASRMALKKAGLTIEHIDRVELNEAFAAQSLAVLREMPVAPDRLNVCGGAIALGHPLGCSGARIAVTLLNSLRRSNVQWGLATMCVGVGQGVAVLIENVT